jgi:hypothetical protein
VKNIIYGVGILVFLVVISIGMGVLNFTCGAVDNAAKVAQKELYPEALLRKYEWFKNASAELDKKQADIAVYSTKIKTMREEYAGEKRSQWDRVDKEISSVWEQELAGIKASYNGLSAEYNSQMSKINWALCNVGKLPPGATTPLPREYRSYVEN